LKEERVREPLTEASFSFLSLDNARSSIPIPFTRTHALYISLANTMTGNIFVTGGIGYIGA
jgi:hypothetical protein